MTDLNDLQAEIGQLYLERQRMISLLNTIRHSALVSPLSVNWQKVADEIAAVVPSDPSLDLTNLTPASTAVAEEEEITAEGDLEVITRISSSHVSKTGNIYSWYGYAGEGMNMVRIDLWPEDVRAFKAHGYDVTLFDQQAAFTHEINVIVGTDRRVKQVLAPLPFAPKPTLIPATVTTHKRTFVPMRNVDTSAAEQGIARARLCCKLGLPIDATDDEIAEASNMTGNLYELPDYVRVCFQD